MPRPKRRRGGRRRRRRGRRATAWSRGGRSTRSYAPLCKAEFHPRWCLSYSPAWQAECSRRQRWNGPNSTSTRRHSTVSQPASCRRRRRQGNLRPSTTDEIRKPSRMLSIRAPRASLRRLARRKARPVPTYRAIRARLHARVARASLVRQ